MKFYINDTYTETVDINTLAELKAYALGGTGKIEINYTEVHPLTGELLNTPVLRKVES